MVLFSAIATIPTLKLTRNVYALKNPKKAIITTIYRLFRQNLHDNGSISGFISLLSLKKQNNQIYLQITICKYLYYDCFLSSELTRSCIYPTLLFCTTISLLLLDLEFGILRFIYHTRI